MSSTNLDFFRLLLAQQDFIQSARGFRAREE
jgi:hypothetical protein